MIAGNYFDVLPMLQKGQADLLLTEQAAEACGRRSIVIEAELAAELTLRVPYNTEDACFSSHLQKKGGGGPSWPHLLH